MNYNNHLKVGYTLEDHKGKKVATSLNSLDFRQFINSLKDSDYQVGRIPPGFEHRADKIADLFYEDPGLDWLVCWTNNISDPFQQLNVGDRIRILA
tara:strand:- start:1161 stop:1448 length:288 start_codon:yes stop_codon:yes gene_type:complete